MSIYERRDKTGEFWQDYGFVVITAALIVVHFFITSLMGYYWTWAPQHEAGEPVVGSAGRDHTG